MDTMNRKHKLTVNLLVIAALAAMLALASGCPQDDTANMAQQMGAARPGATKAPSKPAADNGGGQQTSPPPGMAVQVPADGEDTTPANPMMAGGEGSEDGAAEDGATPEGEEPAGESDYDGPVVMITNLEIKAPYPEFDEAGRYNLSFDSELKEATPAGVWEMRALDAEGNVVGSAEQFLALSYGWQKPLTFRGLYCTTAPVKVEMRLTDKQAATPGEEGGEESGGSGNSGGGNSSGGSGGRGPAGMS